MTVHQLYASRLTVAIIMGVVALVVGILGCMTDRLLLVPSAMFAAVAVMTYRMARESYRFDLGLSGPPECRELVREARAWAENGYRTPAEVAAGIPPRDHPPEPRS